MVWVKENKRMSVRVISSLAVSLALTLILESGFFLLARKRDKKDFKLLLLVNILTNPVVVLSYWLAALYTAWNTTLVMIPLELFAVFVEGFYYKKYSSGFKRPYLFSLGANAFSFGTGMLIQLLF